MWVESMIQAAFLNEAFWQQFLVMAIGVLAGVPLAVWVGLCLFGRQVRHQQQQAEATLEERRRQLQISLKKTLERLKPFLSGLEGDVVAQHLVVARVDAASSLEWLSVQEAATFSDVPLRDQMNNLRDIVKQIDTMLTVLMRFDFDPMTRHAMILVDGKQVGLYGTLRPFLVSAIQNCAKKGIGVCDALLSAIPK
jgi:hypothetical protein